VLEKGKRLESSVLSRFQRGLGLRRAISGNNLMTVVKRNGKRALGKKTTTIEKRGRVSERVVYEGPKLKKKGTKPLP